MPQVNFHTTLAGEAIVTLLYHKPLDDVWQAAAAALRARLAKVPAAAGNTPHILGEVWWCAVCRCLHACVRVGRMWVLSLVLRGQLPPVRILRHLDLLASLGVARVIRQQCMPACRAAGLGTTAPTPLAGAQ